MLRCPLSFRFSFLHTAKSDWSGRVLGYFEGDRTKLFLRIVFPFFYLSNFYSLFGSILTITCAIPSKGACCYITSQSERCEIGKKKVVFFTAIFPIRHFVGDDECGGSNHVAVEQVRIPWVWNKRRENLGSCQLRGYAWKGPRCNGVYWRDGVTRPRGEGSRTPGTPIFPARLIMTKSSV